MMNPLVVMSRLGRKGRSEGRRRIRDWWGGVGAGKGAKMVLSLVEKIRLEKRSAGQRRRYAGRMVVTHTFTVEKDRKGR